MKHKNFLKKLAAVTLGFVMTLGVGAAGYATSAGETRASSLLYTLDTSDSKAQGSNNSYTGSCDVTFGDITWCVCGNADQTPWRIGGKSLSKVDREIYTKTAADTMNIDEVKVVLGSTSGSITFNSFKLMVSANSDFSSSTTYTGTASTSSTAQSFAPTGGFGIGKYFKFVLNVTVSGKNNKYITFDKVEFCGSPVSSKTLTSIAVSGDMTNKTYTVGNEFDPAGLTATGTYDDASTADLSELADWSFTPATAALGTTSVSVTASYDNVTSTAHTVNGISVVAEPTEPTDCVKITDHTEWNSKVYKTGGTEPSANNGYKQGSSSASFTFNINSIPAGTHTIVVYAAAWSGATANLNVTTHKGSTTDIVVQGDSEISASSPFKTSKNIWSSDYRYSVPVTDITETTDLTLNFSKRAVLWYVGYIAAAVHTVEIKGGSSSIYTGGTTTFTASCDQEGCTGITWESSDTSVATVANGKVIGLTSGSTTISATCVEGGSDSVKLTVNENALVLSKTSIDDAEIGGSVSLTASLSGVSGETVNYAWESNNTDAVTVGETGNPTTINFVGGGNATITCTAIVNDVEFTNTCSVKVLTQEPVVSFDNPPSDGFTNVKYAFSAVSENITNGTWTWKVDDQDFSFTDIDDSSSRSSRSATFDKSGKYKITATCTGDNEKTASATTNIEITASSSVLTIDKKEVVLQKGSSVSITPTLVVTGSYVDKTTITVTPGTGVSVDNGTTTSGNAVVVTAGNTGGATKVTFSANGQDVDCSISIPSTTTDTITVTDLKATGTTYANFSDVKKNVAIYAGNSQKNNNDIGFRSSNSNSGIVSTTSGGIIAKVIVTWSNTTAGRQLDVYGKNEAYEDATDLYSSSTATQGDLLGSLVYTSATDNNTEITINDSYQYVGVRSKSGATTIADITFVWTEPKPVESVIAGQDSIEVAKGASSQLTWTVLPSDASNPAVEFSMSPELTGVTVTEDGLVEVTKDATVGATSTITIASKENSSIKDTVSLTVLDTYLDNTKVLGRTGFLKFTTEQTFASVKGSENYIEAKYIDGSTKNSKGDNASMWSNTKCYVNNGTEDSPNWVEYNMSSAITNSDNGKQFKFVYTETVNNQTYTQTSNPFTISVDNVTIKSAITLYYSNNDSYAHSHDFTKDAEYSATGTVTWSVVNAYSKASITQLGVLTIVDAPTNVGASMQFIVRAVCGACTRECTVTLKCEPATSVSVDWPDTIAHEASGTFTATVETEYARQAVCWTSDNEALTITPQSNKLRASWSTIHLESNVDVNVTAFVDEDGDEKYTEGEAIATKTITIHAAEIPVTEVNITDEDIEIWQDDDDAVNKAQFTLHATVTEGASVQKALWSIVEGSDNVVVSSGSIYEGLSKSWKFTGNSGTATIRATSMNKENVQVYDELTVTVKQSVLSDISVDASASTVVKEFEKDHVITASDYSGLVVKATYQSGNESVVTPTSVTCDTSKVGTSTVVVSYTLNGVTKQDSYQVTIHAPSLNVVKKTVTESHTDPTEHDAGISSGEQLLNSGASIPSIEVDNPGYVVTKLQFTCRYNKTIDPAVTVEAKIGNTSLGSQTVGNNFNGTLIFENTTKATGQIVFSFTNHCTASSKCGTFYWTSLTMYDEGETIHTTSYSNNKMSDAMYAFIDKYSEELSAGKWDTIFDSSEYAALSANDKALFKDGVVSGTDDSGTKTSSKEFADFINKYDEVLATNDGLINYLNRQPVEAYTITIDYNHDGLKDTVKAVAGEYKLPEAPTYEGYVFQGWLVNGETKAADSPITVSGNMTITAQWVQGITFSSEFGFKFTGLDITRFQLIFNGTCPSDAEQYGFLYTKSDIDLTSLTAKDIEAGVSGVGQVTGKKQAVLGTSYGNTEVSVVFYYIDGDGQVHYSEVITTSFDEMASKFDLNQITDPYARLCLEYYLANLDK